MNKIPAFPVLGEGGNWHVSDGMTLRDYFAAKAMQALVKNGSIIPFEAAQAAFIVADAMLEARNK